MNTIQTSTKYVPRLHLKSQLQLRPSVKFQMHILAPSDKRLPMHALEPSIIRCYTDGYKLNGRAGARFYIEYASGSQTDQNFFHLGRYSTVFQAEVFAIAMLVVALQ